MTLSEETIDATLDANGQLQLAKLPQLPPGPVQVTIRLSSAAERCHGLADAVRAIATDQRARGFMGRSPEELAADDEARGTEDAERDRELDAARDRAEGT